MIGWLHQFLVPLLMFGLVMWAGWLAFANEAESDVPRVLSGQLPLGAAQLSVSRSLHVAHLAVLALAGVVAGGAVLWWIHSPAGAVARLVIAVSLVWSLGDLLPRLLAAIEVVAHHDDEVELEPRAPCGQLLGDRHLVGSAGAGIAEHPELHRTVLVGQAEFLAGELGRQARNQYSDEQ